MVWSGGVVFMDLVKYFEDVNIMLFDILVIGVEVYKSIDVGKMWNKIYDGYLDGIYYLYGYYFGRIYVDLNNFNGIYIYGVFILKLKDGGKIFVFIDVDNVYVDYYVFWINLKMFGYFINGNDGGVNISYDDGKNWIKCNILVVG